MILRTGELLLPPSCRTSVSPASRSGTGAASTWRSPGGLDTARGAAARVPVLAPWANPVAARRYRAAGVSGGPEGACAWAPTTADCRSTALLGRSRWRVDRLRRAATSLLGASIDVDAPAFSVPHRIDVRVRASESRLTVDTTVTATGRRRVPVAFGEHRTCVCPARPGRDGAAAAGARTPRPGYALDPTGASTHQPAEADAIAAKLRRPLRSRRDRRFAFEGEGRARDRDAVRRRLSLGAGLGCHTGGPSARWSRWPRRRTRSSRGTTPLVGPGDSCTASSR